MRIGRKPAAIVLALAIGPLALAGCGQPPVKQASPPAPATPAPAMSKPAAQVATTRYFCDDGRTVDASYAPPDAATVTVDGRAHAMTIARSGSGARYVGAGLQWWTKGLDRGAIAPLGPKEEIAAAPGVNCSTLEAPVSPPEPGQPGGLPDDRTPVSEAPFTPTSAQGAANVAQTYYALIGEGRYGQAWALWSSGGQASGQTQAAFVASFARYRSYHALVGAPGEIEGAVGSLYVEVPVVIYGRLAAGPELHQSGKMTLRRVNDVPGSTAAQRLWHVAGIELTP